MGQGQGLARVRDGQCVRGTAESRTRVRALDGWAQSELPTPACPRGGNRQHTPCAIESFHGGMGCRVSRCPAKVAFPSCGGMQLSPEPIEFNMRRALDAATLPRLVWRLQPLDPAHSAPFSTALGLDSGDRLDRLDRTLPFAPTGLGVGPAPHRADRAALASGLLPPGLGLGLPLPVRLGLGLGLGLQGLGLRLPPRLLSRLLTLESSPLGPRLRKERLRLRSCGAAGSMGSIPTSTPSSPSVRASVG